MDRGAKSGLAYAGVAGGGCLLQGVVDPPDVDVDDVGVEVVAAAGVDHRLHGAVAGGATDTSA
ncbi:hypothetical protein GCM10009779_09380 [Polymorphospora rubra]|uniref:Uncharacterized protein n=1 Tax=Polymorphospora rubra TaxID=338584 RepID=A0A810NBY7_9ACTN|nr:hypothetical protein [Polymorphospora rubra]BCJ69599.1 hypothetical protein Prubr_66200 [Polymorphospora rubra]